jgi:hypothetical protein
MIKRVKDTWFVSFKNIRIEAHDHSRLTATFATELDAKRFARSRNRTTDKIYAGTINPHNPKRTITPEQIFDWLGE